MQTISGPNNIVSPLTQKTRIQQFKSLGANLLNVLLLNNDFWSLQYYSTADINFYTFLPKTFQVLDRENTFLKIQWVELTDYALRCQTNIILKCLWAGAVSCQKGIAFIILTFNASFNRVNSLVLPWCGNS